MDQATIRFLAEIAARRRIGRSMNAKAEYNSGMLRGNGLYGDNGAPTPKSGKKARLTLALPRGKADIDAQARRARDAERGLVDREKVTPWQITPEMRKQCDAMPKDDVVSVDMPSAMGKVAKNMLKRAWRPGDPDGSESYELPGGNGMPIQRTRGKAIWTESPGYAHAKSNAERVDVVATKPARPPRGNRPKPAWKDASEVDFKVVRIRSFVLKK
jgi:hypothetical protein